MKGRWVWVKSHNAIFGWTSIHHLSAILMFTTLPGWMKVGAPQDPSSSALHWRREIWNGRMFSMTLGDCSKWNPKKTQMENGGSIFIYIYMCINRPPTNKNIWNIHKYTGNHRVYISILSLQLGHALSPGLRPSAPWHSCAGSASKNETCSLPDLRTNTILDENGKIIFWKVYIYIYIYTHWTCP